MLNTIQMLIFVLYKMYKMYLTLLELHFKLESFANKYKLIAYVLVVSVSGTSSKFDQYNSK